MTKTLSRTLELDPPEPEAYTTTVVGPDGIIYATSIATLYAIGN